VIPSCKKANKKAIDRVELSHLRHKNKGVPKVGHPADGERADGSCSEDPLKQ